MNRSSEEIEREVEATRSELDRTVEALKEKITPGQLVDELMGAFRGSGGGSAAGRMGGEVLGNLQTQVRDNPLPVALIGAGLAWLMFGKPPASGRRLAGGSQHFVTDASMQDAGVVEGRQDGEFGVSQQIPGSSSRFADAARSGIGSVGSAASSAKSSIGSAASSAKSSIGSAASSAKSSVGSAASRAAETARGAQTRLAGAAGDAASSLRSGASQAGQRVQTAYASTLEKDPLIIAALGVVVGAALGAAFPATAAERRHLGPVRDKALERGRRLATEGMEDVKSVASAAIGTVREEADRQGLNAESGEGLIDKAAQVARAGLDAAKQEASQRRPH